jgi:hypothetical protein
MLPFGKKACVSHPDDTKSETWVILSSSSVRLQTSGFCFLHVTNVEVCKGSTKNNLGGLGDSGNHRSMYDLVHSK